MHWHRFTLVLLALLASVGCDQAASAPGSTQVRIGYFANFTHAQAVLVAMAYTYLASAFIGMAINRLRRREVKPAEEGVRKEDMRDAG